MDNNQNNTKSRVKSKENRSSQPSGSLSSSTDARIAEMLGKQTAQQKVELSNRTRLLIVLASIGAFGCMVFGYFMERTLAPSREAAHNLNSFGSVGEMLIIPGFLCFGVVLFFALHELYKTYRALNDPNSYRSKSRRSRRTQLH